MVVIVVAARTPPWRAIVWRCRQEKKIKAESMKIKTITPITDPTITAVGSGVHGTPCLHVPRQQDRSRDPQSESVEQKYPLQSICAAFRRI